MTKLNKPRSATEPDEASARAFLIIHEIDPLTVEQAHHFSDGSLSLICSKGEDRWHDGFEFDPGLTAKIAMALKSLGVEVKRSDG